MIENVKLNSDGKCDIPNTCADESDCNGFLYGLRCDEDNYLPVHWICNEISGCADGNDEEQCDSHNVSELEQCVHYYGKRILGKNNYGKKDDV